MIIAEKFFASKILLQAFRISRQVLYKNEPSHSQKDGKKRSSFLVDLECNIY